MAEVDVLLAAAKAGDGARVRTLIAARPALVTERLSSGESPLMSALYHGHRHVALMLAELGAEVDVFAAAALGNIGALKKALTEPRAVDRFAYDGWTPLHLSAFFGHEEAASLLLDSGADPRAASRNSMRNTPLHAATAGRQERVAIMLLERGGDPHAIDAGGSTPRMIAEENRMREFLARLENG